MEFDKNDSRYKFGPARLKHGWANHHINNLHAEWQAFLKTDFCSLILNTDERGNQTIEVSTVESLPASIPLMLGDAIHNLRCALDYTINAALGRHDSRLTFPMHEGREELIASFRTDEATVGGRKKGRGGNAAIEMAVPGIAELIVEHIAPYKGGHPFLWVLGKLDNRDKHRLLVPIVVPQTVSGVDMIDEKHNNSMINGTYIIDAGRTARFMSFGPTDFKITNKGKVSAEIFIHDAGVIERQPAFPTLVQMSRAVSETIDLIEQFVSDVS